MSNHADRILNWLDERLPLSSIRETVAHKTVPCTPLFDLLLLWWDDAVLFHRAGRYRDSAHVVLSAVRE